jgi:hypothetical protein
MAGFASMFDRFWPRCSRLGLPIALGWTLVGCGATAGADWVNQPESASGWSTPEQRSIANVPMQQATGASIPATADSEPVAENHQRLSHTVTLGAVDATQPDQPAPGPYGPGVSVTINNYGQQGGAAPGYGYAGYYGGYGAFGVARGGRSSGVTGASRSSASSMQAGQNWPTIADHGTSFPLRAVPAGSGRGAGQ